MWGIRSWCASYPTERDGVREADDRQPVLPAPCPTGGGSKLTAAEKMIAEYMKAHPGASMGEAYGVCATEKPELFDESADREAV